MGIRIGILDSGVMIQHDSLRKYNIKGYSINTENNGHIAVSKDYEDDIGHGTAIYYLLQNSLNNIECGIEIVNIKIYSKEHLLEYEDFVKILEYIYNNEDFDFINISSGIVCCGSVLRMQNICNAFFEKNCIVVAAYDNEGAVSFPAALEHVVGVDSGNGPGKIQYLDYGIVDILCKSEFVRVPWNDGKMTLVKGNSFSCALVTAELVKQKAKKVSLDKIFYKRKSQYLSGVNPQMPIMKKSVVFPFNKEIHSVACNEDLLGTEIIAYYSYRETGQTGKRICDIIKWSNNQKYIYDINTIDWDSFDSMIIGHTDELEQLTKTNFKYKLLEEAHKRGKVVYSFDPLNHFSTDDNKFYFPYINNDDVPNNYGKLYKTDKPILSIVGTSSRQGKFTLQLILKRKLSRLGYKIGQIGTEPSSLLFGMDGVFPCGYNSTVNLNLYNTLAKMNQMIYYISQKDVDIILTGSQNAVVTYNDNNIQNYPLYHQIVLQAIKPDAMLLCINPFDSIEYIKQTIYASESLTDGNVIATVCFPYDVDENWTVMQNKRMKISQQKAEYLKNEIKSKLGIDMYVLDDLNDQDKLIDRIISYFTD